MLIRVTGSCNLSYTFTNAVMVVLILGILLSAKVLMSIQILGYTLTTYPSDEPMTPQASNIQKAINAREKNRPITDSTRKLKTEGLNRWSMQRSGIPC